MKTTAHIIQMSFFSFFPFVMALIFSVSILTSAGAQDPSTDIDQLKTLYKRPTSVPYPASNPYSEAKQQLGAALFFDPRLSGSDTMSCAGCHKPTHSFSDGLPKAVGHGRLALDRRTPTVLNLAWANRLFWDGRASSLEQQALDPIGLDSEMHMNVEHLSEKLGAVPAYVQMFQKAFPGQSISPELVAKAIATFERGLVSGPAPFDRWIDGEKSALSEKAVHGFLLFNGQAKCASCHSGWSFTDGSFHDIGMPDADLGRGKLLPNLVPMQHAFKTPTLRDVSLRGPFMHDGSEKSLESVVEFYNQGGQTSRQSKSWAYIHFLDLSQTDKKDLVEFLKTLSSDTKPMESPVLPQ